MLAAADLTPLSVGALAAQDVRGWAQTSVRYFELRPIVVGLSEPGEAESGPVESAWVASQDVGFTAWGFGVQGLSATGLVRARERFTGDLDWPQADDPFDVLVAYAQLQRGRLRARLGRQATPSGLGFSGFDGAALRWDAVRWWAEGFGGRSLARGLSETRREALRGIEDFVPDQEAYLWGGAVGVRLGVTDVTARYQREIIADRSGLVGERAALDVSSVLPWALRLRASADYDVPFGRWGKAHLTLQRALHDGRVLAEVEARRYLPYFELSTVWGFFSPVPYHEGRVRVSAGLARESGVQVAFAARSYGDPSTTTVLSTLEGDGWLAEAAAFWAPRPSVRLDASYQIDWGASAYLSAIDAGVRWQATTDLALRASGTSFQQFEAFRLGDGRAVGGGLAAEWAATAAASIDAGLLVVRQDAGRGAADDVWNQTRAWFGLRWAFGDDPGMRPRRP